MMVVVGGGRGDVAKLWVWNDFQFPVSSAT